MITENVYGCWASSLFLGLNFEDFYVPSGTGSMILIFEDKGTACITGCSAYAGAGFFVCRRIFLDSVDLWSNKRSFTSQIINRPRAACSVDVTTRKELLTISISCMHNSHFPFVANGPVLYAMHSTQSFSSSHRCPGHV